jgi:hypothetical protein
MSSVLVSSGSRSSASAGAAQNSLRQLALGLALPLALAPLAAGCGDEAEPPAVTVAIETGQPPALIAFRDDADAEWHALPIDGGSSFQIEPAGPYRVVIVCEAASALEIKEYARVVEDGASIEHACAGATQPFHLRGRMAQPGVAYFGAASRGGGAPAWDFDFPATPGMFDLVMRSADRIAIRRDVAIERDAQLGAMDLDQEGAAQLIATPFTVQGVRAGELISTGTRLDTGSTAAVLQDAMSGAGAWTAKLAPESMLRATDRQTAVLMATELASGPSGQNRYRIVQRDVRVGDQTAVTLPPPMGPVTFAASADALVATWQELPEHDEISLERYGISWSGTRSHELTLSRSFMEATMAASGAASATLDVSDIPGFKSEWRQDPVAQQAFVLTARRGSSPEIALSRVNEWVYPTHALGAAAQGRGAR